MTSDRESIVRWLVYNLDKRGRGAKKALAAHLGVPDAAVTKMARLEPGKESRDISATELLRIADFFGEHPPIADRPAHAVAVMGIVGAGGAISVLGEQSPPEGHDQVEIPFTLPQPLVAFEVRGDSMHPYYDAGEIIVCFRDQSRPDTWFHGRTAVVRTADGDRYLKRVTAGKRKGTFTLLSSNADPMEDVKIEWFGEIVATVKAEGVRKLEGKKP